MSDLRVTAQQQNVTRANDGTWVALRATRDGAPIVLPWYQALVLEGRAFAATATDPAAELTLMTTYADTSKTLFIDIPDGTAAFPLKVHAVLSATGGTLAEAYAFTSDTLNGTGGTETLITPVNMRRDAPIATASTVAHTVSSAVDTVTGTEVMLTSIGPITTDVDAGTQSVDLHVIHWLIGQEVVSPIVIDAGSINIAVNTPTSGTGRADAQWVELPESVFT